jgi:hypothetical protein
MRKYICLALGVFLAAVLIQASQTDSRTLNVTVHYKGTGNVDGNHLIAVAIWDSPAFMEPNSHTMPTDVKVTKTNDSKVTFSGVSISPVYVSAAYDPSGKWDGTSGPPPAGTSLGMYSKEPGKPEPVRIDPGKSASIELSFDDRIKMK